MLTIEAERIRTGLGNQGGGQVNGTEWGHGDKGTGLSQGANSQPLAVEGIWISKSKKEKEGRAWDTGCDHPLCSPPQGMLSLVLNCIDRLNVYTTAAHFAEYAGEEAAESWKEIVNLLYELLGKGLQS